jgi:putative oxidoreductase
MKALQPLFRTSDTVAPLIARLTLGLVMFPHGAQKVLGWFGGYGYSGTMGFFTQQMHIPAPLAFLAIAAEFAGSIGLILGLLGRLSAFGIAVNMVVAILMVHGANGFFMNWYGNQKGEGYEYHLLAIGLALIVIIKGAGKASLDALIARSLSKPNP